MRSDRLASDVDLAPLHADPRWAALLRRLGMGRALRQQVVGCVIRGKLVIFNCEAKR